MHGSDPLIELFSKFFTPKGTLEINFLVQGNPAKMKSTGSKRNTPYSGGQRRMPPIQWWSDFKPFFVTARKIIGAMALALCRVALDPELAQTQSDGRSIRNP